MSMLDGILNQIGGNATVQNLAARVGLTPQQVESAIAALSRAHAQPGDTAQDAAATTGLPLGKVQELIAQIGGEGALARVAALAQGTGILEGLDRDGDGNPLNDLGGLVGGLFGGRK